MLDVYRAATTTIGCRFAPTRANTTVRHPKTILDTSHCSVSDCSGVIYAQRTRDPNAEQDPKASSLYASPSTNSSLVFDSILVEKVTSYVEEYMLHYDSSHDFDHVLRVLGLARRIASVLSAPDSPSSSTRYDPLIITLSSLLHDVGDKKYLKPGDNADTMVYELLVSFGAPNSLAEKIQTVVSNVSFSAETKSAESREKVQRLVQEIPELGIVQDADRLDAIGGIGIGRTFTYGGAVGKMGEKGRRMQDTIQHFVDKLECIEGLMKTIEGKRLAAERTRRLKIYREWWEEEIQEAQEGLKAT
ncbi:hydrolase [Histoplasma capsulatum G186AR]|uniref:Hydrolase n=1 Tax=Ajellomyces capsulatus (strain G186AR / H82 / ATCC MYA-2454 / RMSCC 2432) TaxID=447093 RepID=C0NZ58_AJECG|nr:hydrolase [Histoplasma capsulatum G186AR]EEH03498.1 hydrolase [Histoplasma capsulatum G186AR]